MSDAHFWQWVNAEMAAQRLTFRAIERAGALSNGAISKRAQENLPPTLANCQALAVALDCPLERVLRQAGLLPPLDADPELAELQAAARAVPPAWRPTATRLLAALWVAGEPPADLPPHYIAQYGRWGVQDHGDGTYTLRRTDCPLALPLTGADLTDTANVLVQVEVTRQADGRLRLPDV